MKKLNKRRSRGYTLIELVLVSAILIVLVLSITPFLKSSHDAWETDKNLTKMLNDARHSMDAMTRELRSAPSIANYTSTTISFGVADIILDDGDSGFITSFTTKGKAQGSYANDYLMSTGGTTYAIWRPNIIVSGNYDVFVWYVQNNGTATSNTNLANYTIYRNDATSTAVTVNQQTNGSRWFRIAENFTFDIGTEGRVRLQGPSDSLYKIADGIKLVYRGTDSKTFYYDNVAKNLYFRSTSEANSSDNLLLSGINNLVFGFYQADGVTSATSNENLSIIRIALTLSDPENKAPDLVLQSEVELRTKNVKTKEIVINEIVHSPSPPTVLYFDNFDGGVIINDVEQPSGTYPNYRRYNNWFDHFDNTDIGWTAVAIAPGVAAPWQYGIPTSYDTLDDTGRRLWATNLIGNYPVSVIIDEVARSPEIFFPTTASGNHYMRYYRINDNNLDAVGDNSRFCIWTPGTATRACTADLTDNVTSWTSQPISTSGYGGANQQIEFRFRTDGDAKVDLGHYVQDIVVYSSVPSETRYMVDLTGSVLSPPPAGKRLLWEGGTPDVGQVAAGCFSGTGCIGTDMDNDYHEVIDASIVTPEITIPAGTNPLLEFYMWTNFEGDTAAWDGGIVEVSTDGGTNWTKLTAATHNLTPDYNVALSTSYENPLGGQTAYCYTNLSWRRVTANLGAFAGSNVVIRFHFGTDNYAPSSATHRPGWFIDDIRVFGNAYQYIELFNPTPYPIDLVNYRIITDESFRDIDDDGAGPDEAGFDKIVAYSAGSTIIQPNKYAIVAANGSHLYEAGSPYKLYIDARVLAGDTVRLQTVDRIFGVNHLNSNYGKLTIQDPSWNIIDYLGYNIAFYDDMESSGTIGLWSARIVAGTTTWGRGTIVAGDNLTNNFDRTRGTATGSVYGTNLGGTYAVSSTSDLITPAIEYTAITPTLSFYHKYRIAAGDTAVVQQSIDGGATWTNLGTSFDVGVSTGTWDRVTRELSVNTVGMIKFRFTSDAAAVDTGWYIDNVAVFWSWGAAPGSNRSLERRNWQGSTSIRENWAESTNLIDNTAPIPDVFGTPGGKNSVTP